MTAIDHILGEFIDAWKAGRRPDVDEYLARAHEEERDELARQLTAWLEIAPTPQFDEATRAAIAEEPQLRAALEAAAPSGRRSRSGCRPSEPEPGSPSGMWRAGWWRYSGSRATRSAPPTI